MINSTRPRAAAIGVIAALILAAGALGGAPATAQTDSDPDTMVVIRGGGWGHGVGMSQYGTWGRAADGQDHDDILDFYYPGAELVTEAMPDVRVHIHSGGGTVVTPTVEGAALQLIDAQGDVFYNHRNGAQLTVDKVPGGFTVIKPNGRNVCIDDDEGDECVGDSISIRFEQGQPIHVDVVDQVAFGTTDNEYQWGELVIHERPQAPDTTLWVVLEDLPMDRYIYGLAEVPRSWPIAALETQAVAGRTYAYSRIVARRASADWTAPWDLYSTVNDQVYHGYENETGQYGERWTDAVDATADEVMLFGETPITAFYSSSNGGYSEESGYVFSAALPYLPAQPDDFDSYENPNAEWRRDYTGAELAEWLRAAGRADVGTVTDIVVSGNVGASGRLDRATLTVSGPRGSGSLTGSQFFNAVNSGVARQGGGLPRQLRSTKFTIEVLGGQDPIGAVNDIDRSGNEVDVSGWVFDPDSQATVEVQVRVDGAVVATIDADERRYDIDAVFAEGESRGFRTTVTVGAGARQVCVYADNLGPGDRLLLGCQIV